MAAALTGVVKKSIAPNTGMRAIFVETSNVCDSSDTIAVDLADFGCKTLKHIIGCVETTSGSVVVTEAPTTAVSGTTLTITVGGSTVTGKKRSYVVYAE